jgi:hypothetical protein
MHPEDSPALVPAQSARLAELEGVIERGLETFREVGAALLEIRDSRLYRGTHESFEGYVGERWALGRSRAYQLMAAARLSTVVDVPNQRQARELARPPDEEAVERVWRRAHEQHEEVTAEHVREAVEEELRPAGHPLLETVRRELEAGREAEREAAGHLREFFADWQTLEAEVRECQREQAELLREAEADFGLEGMERLFRECWGNYPYPAAVVLMWATVDRGETSVHEWVAEWGDALA